MLTLPYIPTDLLITSPHTQASPFRRMLIWCMLLMLGATACQPWQDPTADLPTLSPTTLDSLALVDVRLGEIAELHVKEQVDSLLRWTASLKDRDSEVALIYARQAADIATKLGYKEDQALARYHVALLEGRQSIYQEGLADPLINAQRALRLWPANGDEFWLMRFSGLLGEVHFRNGQLDSAAFYFQRVAQWVAEQEITSEQLILECTNLHNLGDLELQQRDFQAADSIYRLAQSCYENTDDLRALGILYKSRATVFEEKRQLDSAIVLLQKSLDIGKSIEDDFVITHALQGLGNVYMLKYRRQHDLADFERSLRFFRQSQTREESNPYYTNGRIARLMHSRSSRDRITGTTYVDSAIVYYKLSLEQARDRGALNYFKDQSRQLDKLCGWLVSSRDRNCDSLLGTSRSNYLYVNYSAVVDTITQDLAEANSNRLTSELTQQEVTNKQRIRNNWGVSGSAIVVLGLVFLLLWQKQKQRRLEARMEALRAQINPHFFSNSLNAIESLVNLDQRKAASKYLIHFSRLTRRVLNSSMEPTTSLEGELATTEHFLALEQLRFKDKLYYDIEIDPEISPEQVEIPSLILQPYLENAIWHGIKPKTVPSLLQIKARKRGKQLYITIEDDGIGREAAAQQQEGSVLKRKSHGMRITKERLRRFGGGRVEVEDLYTEEGKARGTRIHLYLPLKYLKHDKKATLAKQK